MQIELKILDKELYKGRTLEYATPGSAAIDLISAEDFNLPPGHCKMIKTGVAIHIDSWYNDFEKPWPMYHAGIILPRSGLGHRAGLVLGNTIGLIDGDYQGELLVSAWNRNDYDYSRNYYPQDNIIIERGDRFAQLLFVPIVKPEFKIVEEFSNKTERGSGGFGSSGV